MMTPVKFITRFVEELRIPNSYVVSGLAKKIVEKSVNIMEGKRTTTIASAALYFAIELLGITSVTSADVSRVAKIAENTLKSASKVLKEKKSSLITNEELQDFKSQLEK